MPDGSQANVVDNGSYHQFHFVPGLPGGLPAIKFMGADDSTGTGIWYDPETKSIKFRYAGTDVYTFDDAGGISFVAAGGPLLIPAGSAAAPGLAFVAEPNTGLIRRGSPSGMGFVVTGNIIGGPVGVEFQLVSSVPLSWSGSIWGAGSDVLLYRDGASATLALRNSTAAQTFRIYNTYTDASNYERGDVGWSGNVFEIGTVNAGTGSNRSVRLKSTLTIAFSTGGDRFTMNTTAFSPAADATYDLGNSGGFFKDLYVRRRLNKTAVITYSASMTPDASLGEMQAITVTNGTAMTINAPTNPVTFQYLRFLISNTSGGAMGVITWNAVFKMTAFTNPATANRRFIEFFYDGSNWYEVDRSPADIPN